MKKLSIILMSLLLAVNIMADDFSQESAFGEETNQEVSAFSDSEEAMSGFGEESAFGNDEADTEMAGFGESESSDGFGGEMAKSLEFSGKLKSESRLFFDDDVDKANSVPSLDLDLKYKKANSELNASLNFSEENKSGELKEGSIKLFYDNFDISVGKIKVVWGKGDKVHVIDNFNGEDLSDFVNQDYLDRKIAENMIKVNYYIGSGTLELVYTPEFNGNGMPTDDLWKMGVQKSLETFYISKLGITGALIKSQEEKATKIKNGQIGARYTNSKAGYDYGISYYKGALRTPSLDSSTLELNYDDVNIFGSELSTVLFGINSRAELAYYMTEDTDGKDATVHNNKIAWVIGGDRDLPIHNVNVNIQNKGEYILNNDEINGTDDVEYNSDEKYTTNTIITKISDKFKNERILPELQFVYNIEDGDYMLNNQIEIKLKDDTSMTVMYKMFEGDSDTIFGEFDKNDFAEVKFEYEF